MTDGYAAIKTGYGARERCRRVTLYQYEVGLFPGEYLIQLCDHSRTYIVRRLISLHYRQIEIDVYLERFQKRKQKMFMLAGGDDYRLEKFLSQFVDHGRQLNGLGARSKKDENLFARIDRSMRICDCACGHVVEHKHFSSKAEELPRLYMAKGWPVPNWGVILATIRLRAKKKAAKQGRLILLKNIISQAARYTPAPSELALLC